MRGGMFLATALVVAACGGQVTASAPTPSGTPAATARPPVPTTDPGYEAVITGWLEAISDRDYERAATFFALGARIGDRTLVQADTTEAIVEALSTTPPCEHEPTLMRPDGLTIWVDVRISGPTCPFLVNGEASHGILIPVQIANGKIICTCPAEARLPS